MNKALLVSAPASNSGKTILTSALLYHFKNRVRPYKCGPDFIDPQFHQAVTGTPSVNLDGFCLNAAQLQWTFHRYFDKEVAIVEGVMGYYDGMEKNASAYDVAKTLHVPTLLVIDGSGSYVTLAALLKGICEFRKDNTVKAVVFNKLSSQNHYEAIKKTLKKELPHIRTVGWIQKDLPVLRSTHLGLDLSAKDMLPAVAGEVLRHIDINAIERLMDYKKRQIHAYPFIPVKKSNAVCSVVYDENFSFLYHDNLCYLQEKYAALRLVKATQNETIPPASDIVVLPGGYVETQKHYDALKGSDAFKRSLIDHASSGKRIYAECAGLIYLGKSIDDKPMSGILDISFTLGKKRRRLGYYYARELASKTTYKGHAFHYSDAVSSPPGDVVLYKTDPSQGSIGGWIQGNIYATYLHSFWRTNAIV